MYILCNHSRSTVHAHESAHEIPFSEYEVSWFDLYETKMTLFFHCRCMRPVGHPTDRQFAGEVAVRHRGVLQDAVPESTDEVRQAAAPTAVAAYRQLAGHRATVLRPARRQDSHRDSDQGHAHQRFII